MPILVRFPAQHSQTFLGVVRRNGPFCETLTALSRVKGANNIETWQSLKIPTNVTKSVKHPACKNQTTATASTPHSPRRHSLRLLRREIPAAARGGALGILRGAVGVRRRRTVRRRRRVRPPGVALRRRRRHRLRRRSVA